MVLAILQARFSSSRFPGKVLAPLQGEALLWGQWQRISRSKKISEAFIATSTEASDDALATFCQSHQIPCVRGPLQDVLARFILAAKSCKQKPDFIVRLTGDCPLSDPQLIDQIIEVAEAGNFDYVSNTIPATFPDGLDIEVIRYSALEIAAKEAQMPSEREHVTLFIKNNPERFRLHNFTADADFSAHRLTIDYPDDLQAIENWLATWPIPVNKKELNWLQIRSAILQGHAPKAIHPRNEGWEKSRKEDPLTPLPLAIGTVQWGKTYGLTNTIGQTSAAEIKNILSLAEKNSFTLLDTAPDYGMAENVIGQVAHSFSIISKTHFINKTKINEADIKTVRDQFHASLASLGQKKIHAILVHYAKDLSAEGGELLWQELESWQAAGWVGKIGCSIYNVEELKNIQRFPLQIIQAPLNILDQRLLHELQRWKNRGTEIHLRSAFLQGALLVDPQSLPDHFAPVRHSLLQLRALWHKHNMQPLQGCLHYLAQLRLADRVVVGISSSQEWQQIIDANAGIPRLPTIDYSPFAQTNENILSPALWPK